MDNQETAFELQDIVWAKISHYPWWPGKISEIVQQNNVHVFKVSFYADPTYCYLEESSIITYSQFNANLNSSFPIDSSLARAINLANNAYNRRKVHVNNSQKLQNLKQVAKPLCQQIEEQKNEEIFSKIEDYQQSTMFEVKQTSNIELKQSQYSKQQQILALLAKYNLDKIPSLPEKVFNLETSYRCSQLIQQSPKSSLQSNQSEDQIVQQFNPKLAKKRKPIVKPKFGKLASKKKNFSLLSAQSSQIAFMKKLCVLLIIEGKIEVQKCKKISINIVKTIKQSTLDHKQKNAESFIDCLNFLKNNQIETDFEMKFGKYLQQKMSKCNQGQSTLQITPFVKTVSFEKEQLELCR